MLYGIFMNVAQINLDQVRYNADVIVETSSLHSHFDAPQHGGFRCVILTMHLPHRVVYRQIHIAAWLCATWPHPCIINILVAILLFLMRHLAIFFRRAFIISVSLIRRSSSVFQVPQSAASIRFSQDFNSICYSWSQFGHSARAIPRIPIQSDDFNCSSVVGKEVGRQLAQSVVGEINLPDRVEAIEGRCRNRV